MINSVSEQDSGWFTCRATNDAGTEEKKAYLLVAGMKNLVIRVHQSMLGAVFVFFSD